MSSRAPGVVLLQGRWVWGEAVEICTSTEVLERGKKEEPQLQRRHLPAQRNCLSFEGYK